MSTLDCGIAELVVGFVCLFFSYWVTSIYGPFEVGSAGDEWVGFLFTVGLVLVIIGSSTVAVGA